MSYNTKNYTEQGGETTHIGGKLIIDEGGSFEGLPSVAAPIILQQVAGDGNCGITFGELWDIFHNQNKLIYFIKDSEADSSVPDATDYSRKLYFVSKMSFEGNLNYYLFLLDCSTGNAVGPSIGVADRTPYIH